MTPVNKKKKSQTSTSKASNIKGQSKVQSEKEKATGEKTHSVAARERTR